MGADQPFGTEGICLGGLLHLSQDRIMLWSLQIKKNVEDWRQIQNSIYSWSSDWSSRKQLFYYIQNILSIAYPNEALAQSVWTTEIFHSHDLS